MDSEEIWFAIFVLEHDDERKNDGVIYPGHSKKKPLMKRLFFEVSLNINDRASLVCVHVRVKVRQQKLHVLPLLFLRNEGRVLQEDG